MDSTHGLDMGPGSGIAAAHPASLHEQVSVSCSPEAADPDGTRQRPAGLRGSAQPPRCQPRLPPHSAHLAHHTRRPCHGPGPTLSAMSSSTPSTGPGGGSCRASMVRAPDCCRCLWRRDDRPVQRSFSRARRVEKGSDHGARPERVSKPGTVQRQSSGAAGRALLEGLPAGHCNQGLGKRGPHRPGLLLCQLLGQVLCTWAIKQNVTPLGNVK